MKLLFVGPPGAGKGTQADRIAELLGIPHISTGDMFRHHVSTGSDLGRHVDEIMKRGDYVPDEITVSMLEGRLAMDDAAEGYILDGFPRTAAQVEALDGLIGEAGLDHVVVFDVGEDALVERLLSRGRDDDNEETIRTRFQIYLDQTAPLIKTYEERGLILRVEGIGPMDEVTERILDKLGVSAPTEA